MSDRAAAVLLAAATVVLAVGGGVLLGAGVEVRETTGGLLVTPIRQLHLVGGYLVAGTVAGVAAVLTASRGARAARARRAPADTAAPAARRPVDAAVDPDESPLTRPRRTTPTTPRAPRDPIADSDRLRVICVVSSVRAAVDHRPAPEGGSG